MSTVEVAPHGPRPPIRLRPAPRCEPVFDDEAGPRPWVIADQLALEWPQPPQWGSEAVPATPAPPAARQAAITGATGDAKLAVRRFVHVCVEVLNGYRPAAHLRRLAMPKEAAGVVQQAVLGAGRAAEMRHGGAPGRRARSTSRHDRGPAPVAVTRLQFCEPRPGAVEAAVLLLTGDRTWAMALRMERHQQSWAATALRLI